MSVNLKTIQGFPYNVPGWLSSIAAPIGCAGEADLWNSHIHWPDAGGQVATTRFTPFELLKAYVTHFGSEATFIASS